MYLIYVHIYIRHTSCIVFIVCSCHVFMHAYMCNYHMLYYLFLQQSVLVTDRACMHDLFYLICIMHTLPFARPKKR